MEGFAEKKIANLMAAIEDAKSRPLPRLIGGLGIRFIGGVAAQLLAERFGSLDALATATADDIKAIEGIGPAIATSITQFFSLPENRALIEKLKQVGVETAAQPTAAARAGDGLAGKVFVITGTLPSMTREQAEQLIKSHGGKVTGSVTKKTSYVLAGADPGGAKYTKATELDIALLDEAGLLALVGGPPANAEDDAGQLPLDI